MRKKKDPEIVIKYNDGEWVQQNSMPKVTFEMLKGEIDHLKERLDFAHREITTYKQEKFLLKSIILEAMK